MGVDFVSDRKVVGHDPAMTEVEACPYRFNPDAQGRALCTYDRAIGQIVRVDTCLRCVKARMPELTKIPDRSITNMPDLYAPHMLPSTTVIHRWAGDAQYVDAGMDGRFSGAKAFLVCGGPSLASIDVGAMRNTGSLIFAVNNAGAYPGVRPHFWTCVDHPKRFHQNIWLDAGICKMISMTHAGHELRRKENGSFRPLGRVVYQCPNVLFYERNVHFQASHFLPQPTVNWGCDPKMQCSEGINGNRSVFLAAIKLLAVLGVKEIYLVGADFHMKEEQPYAWNQEKKPVYDEDGKMKSDPIGSNNRNYRIMSIRLSALVPHLSAAGISIFNATKDSHLDVFPKITYNEAIIRANVGIQDPPDLSEWYEQK